MQNKIFQLLGLFFFSVIVLPSCFNKEKAWSKEEIMGSKVEVNTSGSGYPDLEGKFIEYEYVDFGTFRLAIYDNKIKWRGYGGYFDGIVSQVEPQISKISEDIYFLSWIFGEGGGDNVVVNFKTKKVFAHLRSGNASEDSPSDFEMIHGSVICGPSVDCNFPEGEPISMLRMVLKLNNNTEKFKLPTIFENEKPLIQAHIDARNELFEMPIQFKNDEGKVSIEVDGNITRVGINGRNLKEYQTNVSKIDEGIYFISWLGNDQFGEHLVFNKNTMKIFNHLTSKKIHQEQIYSTN